jgi:SHS2 domain-containing protein
MKKNYALIDHTADLGILVKAKNLSCLFENAAFALFDLMLSPGSVRQRVTRQFQLSAPAVDELLNLWLARLLEDFTVSRIAYGHFDVTRIDLPADGIASEFSLVGRAVGEPFDLKRHRGKKEIKAVTFHGLFVRETAGGWEAQVIFDT